MVHGRQSSLVYLPTLRYLRGRGENVSLVPDLVVRTYLYRFFLPRVYDVMNSSSRPKDATLSKTNDTRLVGICHKNNFVFGSVFVTQIELRCGRRHARTDWRSRTNYLDNYSSRDILFGLLSRKGTVQGTLS